MYSDDSDTGSSDSDATPILNKDESCLHCLPTPLPFNKQKCRNLDLIQKRYLKMKFSKTNRRKHNHHTTKYTLSWIGTNILGNLGDINDTFNQLNLAHNAAQQPTLESLRAQQRFGIHHPNLTKYHPTHPVIIEALPKLNIKENKTQQLLSKHNVCPICQLQFIANNTEDIEIKTKNEEIISKQQIQSVVNLCHKSETQHTHKNNIHIGNELMTSHESISDMSLHETMNSEQNNNLIVNGYKREENMGNGDEEMKECVLDSDAINQQSIVRLWCNHVFHYDCVLLWLSKHNTCPLCRYELPTNNPSYELKRRAETYDHSIYQVMT